MSTPPPPPPPPGAGAQPETFADPAASGVATCYRHPDRETRLSCSSCGRPTCVDCVRPGPVGQKCLECSAPTGRARVVSARDLRRKEGFAGSPVTSTVIAVCVAIALLRYVAPTVFLSLAQEGAQINSAIAGGDWWRILTAAFFHAPTLLLHLLFNMYALWIFGPQVERQVGSFAFATMYLGCAAAGGAAYYFLGGDGTAVGASGAIFGLFGVWLAAALRNRHSFAGRASLQQLLMLLGLNLAITFAFRGIAWQAHVGGLIAGFAIAMVWGQLTKVDARSRWLRTLPGAAVLVLCVALVIVF